jgi:hypothetical protein
METRVPVEAVAAQLAQAWPFDRATAAGNGFIRTCMNWPPTLPPPEATAGDAATIGDGNEVPAWVDRKNSTIVEFNNR